MASLHGRCLGIILMIKAEKVQQAVAKQADNFPGECPAVALGLTAGERHGDVYFTEYRPGTVRLIDVERKDIGSLVFGAEFPVQRSDPTIVRKDQIDLPGRTPRGLSPDDGVKKPMDAG